jgi:hypothetical protein
VDKQDKRLKEVLKRLESLPTHDESGYKFGSFVGKSNECPNQPHRGPQGPNEDIGQCGLCMSFSYRMRPAGESFGYHKDDCSLDVGHPGYCVGGGEGHTPAPKIRG